MAMNKSDVSLKELSRDGPAGVEDLPRGIEGGPESTAPASPGPEARASRWTAGRIIALVIAGLLGVISLALLATGGAALWYDQTQRDGGYVTTDVHDFSTSGSALATEPTELGSAGVGWLYSPSMLDEVRIRVTPTGPDSELFVGIGRSADVDRYLAGVNHTVITEFFGDEVDTVSGSTSVSAPGTQGFWVASTTGHGSQTLVWDPADGSWSVVVMNADGRPGIDIGGDLGARLPALPWIAAGFLAAGAVFLVGGALLIAGAILRRPASRANPV
jgi:hypothetical protein